MVTFHFNKPSHQTTVTSKVHKKFVNRDRGHLFLIHLKTCFKRNDSAIQPSENPRHNGSIPSRVVETHSLVRSAEFVPSVSIF